MTAPPDLYSERTRRGGGYVNRLRGFLHSATYAEAYSMEGDAMINCGFRTRLSPRVPREDVDR